MAITVTTITSTATLTDRTTAMRPVTLMKTIPMAATPLTITGHTRMEGTDHTRMEGAIITIGGITITDTTPIINGSGVSSNPSATAA